MKLLNVPGDRNPSGILTKHMKTDALQTHLHRFNMITTRDGIFTICTLFVR